jgi:hypothetical protein
MARQTAVVEINAFVKGIITEASPLTFPDNASLDEVNLVLNKDGSRNRRLGMNYENSYVAVNSAQVPSDSLGVNSFSWKSPGGYTEEEFIVIQVGTQVRVFDASELPLSGSGLATFNIGNSPTVKMSMATVDGLLFIAIGDGNIYTLDYNGTSITQTSGRLLIRDLFGVADTISGTNLLEGSGIATRPVTTSNAHTYNLRNQTFAYPRLVNGDEDLRDPITIFRNLYGVYQANSDNLASYLYADPNDSGDRVTKRYFAIDNYNNPLGTNRAPVGYFIIDAMNRGASRVAEYQKLMSENPTLTTNITTLPVDRTPGGAAVVEGFAGRVWYSGFSSQVIGGDSESPRMTSYVLFSRLVQSPPDALKCYQEGDPTSGEVPDLVDTDGGFIRLDGAYNIQKMVNVGDSIMVIAENGVWKITGGSGYGFNATNYLTSKITEHGCVSPGSVVIIDNTFMFWSEDGIYHINQNQYGDWVGSNLTNTTIQTLYDDIPFIAKSKCEGLYDSYQRQIRWLYNNYLGTTEPAKELILDANLSAFYPSSISPISGVYPRPLSLVRVPPFQVTSTNLGIITGNGDNVQTGTGDEVVVSQQVLSSSFSEIYYLTASGITGGTVRYTFSLYKDPSFSDWTSYNGVGVDAAAYLLTGWSGMGGFQRMKQVPYLTVYSVKTETGFNAEFTPLNPSSILVQSQWNWTNLASSGKWSPEFQVYRHNRFWAPTDSSSGFDDGDYVVTTKNKLRGRGRVLSLKFRTEPGKDFHLLGWSFVTNVNGMV